MNRISCFNCLYVEKKYYNQNNSRRFICLLKDGKETNPAKKCPLFKHYEEATQEDLEKTISLSINLKYQ